MLEAVDVAATEVEALSVAMRAAITGAGRRSARWRRLMRSIFASCSLRSRVPVCRDGTRGNAESSEGKPSDAADWRKHPIRAWRARYGRYKQTRFYQTWAKRPKFSYGAYVVIMFVLIEMANMFLLWSVVPQLTYDPARARAGNREAGGV